MNTLWALSPNRLPTRKGVEGPNLQEAPANLLRVSEEAVQSGKRVGASPQDRAVIEHEPAEDVSVMLRGGKVATREKERGVERERRLDVMF